MNERYRQDNVFMTLVRLTAFPGKEYDKAREEVVRWLRGLEWEVRGERVLTPRGDLRLPKRAEPWSAALHPKDHAGALAVIALFRLLAPESLSIELDGSMFAFAAACTWLQRNGFPSDPWQVTGRELYLARSRRLGDPFAYLVEVPKEEVEGVARSFPWLEISEASTQSFPANAEPVGHFPSNRVWKLRTGLRTGGSR